MQWKFLVLKNYLQQSDNNSTFVLRTKIPIIWLDNVIISPWLYVNMDTILTTITPDENLYRSVETLDHEQ